MSAEVWYRKWRPQTFSEVTGQEHVTRTLANGVAQRRVAHAYLLCGPRGTGKTTTARILAKAVNCARPLAGEPCTTCESCRAVAEGRALDLVEMDAASNRGIDDIRGLRDRVGYHPSSGEYRVYLIDEVHELTAQAFDALLKTLEEPPPHIIFVLATTDVHKVPATIVSRCQRFDLLRIKHADIVARLSFIAVQEGVEVEPGALDVIARAATGALRDAVNLFEQLASASATALTEAQAREGLGLIADDRARELALLATGGELAAGLELIAAVQDDGVDMRRFSREVTAQLRALLLTKAGAVAGLEGFSAGALADLRRAADAIESRALVRALKAFSAVEFRGEMQPSLPVELALAEVALAAVEADPAADRPAAAPTPIRRPLPPAPAAAPPVSRGPVSLTPIVAAPVADHPRGATAATGEDDPVSDRPPISIPSNGAQQQPAPRPMAPPMIAAVEVAEPAAEAPADLAEAEQDSAEPAVAAGGVTTLAEARGRLREVYTVCKTTHSPTGGMLNSGCDIVGLDGRVVTFGFEHSWMAEKFLPGTQSHRILTEAIQQVFGLRLDVQCIHAPGVEHRLKSSPPRASHLLDEARKLGLPRIQRDQDGASGAS